MKSKLKIGLIGFIIGGLIFGSIGTVLALTYKASDIVYTPSDTSWNVSTVGEAINSLALSKTSDNYSTEEKVVGKWIDGKPIYQKTITDISIAFPWTSQKRGEASMAAVVNNVEHFISCILYTNTGAYIASIGQTSYGSSTWTILTNDPITATSMVIQYTKTTDSASNS